MAKPNLDDYVDVAQRIAEFRAAYPEGTLQSECHFVQADGRWWVVVKASAYRHEDDKRPGQGLAYEVIPGKTPYTRDSELQNAETASWGRAIIAVGAADSTKKIASREEVRNRQPAPPVFNVENAAGRAALRKLCEDKGHLPEVVAGVFEQRYGVGPRNASDDDLLSFVALVESGALTFESGGEG